MIEAVHRLTPRQEPSMSQTHEPDEEDIVIHERQQVAVFVNTRGRIAILGQGGGFDEDQLIVVDTSDVDRLCQALRRAKQEARS